MRKNPKSSLDKVSKICYNKHTKGIRKKVVRGLPSSSDRQHVCGHTHVGSGVFVLPKIIIPHYWGIVKPLLEFFSNFFLWDFRDICSTSAADICIREFYFRTEKENVIHIAQQESPGQCSGGFICDVWASVWTAADSEQKLAQTRFWLLCTPP